MADQWYDPHFALQWDQTSLVSNQTSDEQLDIILSLIANLYTEGTTILDLDMGSGLIEEQLFARRPHASVVGIESSQAMIDLARSRLAPFKQHFQIMRHDLTHFHDALSPAETYALLFSSGFSPFSSRCSVGSVLCHF